MSFLTNSVRFGIDAVIHIGQEIWCVLYAIFFLGRIPLNTNQEILCTVPVDQHIAKNGKVFCTLLKLLSDTLYFLYFSLLNFYSLCCLTYDFVQMTTRPSVVTKQSHDGNHS